MHCHVRDDAAAKEEGEIALELGGRGGAKRTQPDPSFFSFYFPQLPLSLFPSLSLPISLLVNCLFVTTRYYYYLPY